MVSTYCRRWGGAVIIAVVGLVSAFVAPVADAAVRQHDVGVVDLGLLPGGTASLATIVGEDGTVVGAATAADGFYHAVRWLGDGRIADLATLTGNVQSQVAAMNRTGVLVGISNGPDFTPDQAVRWDRQGRITGLAPSFMTSTAVDINDAGQVAGTVGPPVRVRAVRWSSAGRVIYLPVLPEAPTSSASGISARGTVAGILRDVHYGSPQYAVRWRIGRGLEVLGVFPATSELWVIGIDDNDVVVGFLGTDHGQRAVRWDTAGRMTELPVPADTTDSAAVTVSPNGFVLGYVVSAEGQHAARWDPSGALTLLDDAPGSSLAHPRGVNARGEVVGQAVMPDRTTYAVWWDRGGHITVLPHLPNGSYAGATSVNDRGTAVGYAYTGGTEHAVAWHQN